MTNEVNSNEQPQGGAKAARGHNYKYSIYNNQERIYFSDIEAAFAETEPQAGHERTVGGKDRPSYRLKKKDEPGENLSENQGKRIINKLCKKKC